VRNLYFLRLAFCAAVAAVSLWTVDAAAQGEPHFVDQIISHYQRGDYNTALDYIAAEQRLRKTSPLADYYAARIRAQRGDYEVAKTHIIAAIEDSTDFADAVAFQACLLKQAGSNGMALQKWREFLDMVGIEPTSPITPESIVPPEEFAERVRRGSFGDPKDSVSDSSKTAGERYEELMPMPVVDFVELKKRRNALPAEIAPPEPAHLETRGVLPAAVIVVVLFLLLLFVRRYRLKRIKVRPEGGEGAALSENQSVSGVQAEETSQSHPEETKKPGLHPDDDSPYTRALRLKEERKRRAVEIDRLLNKI